MIKLIKADGWNLLVYKWHSINLIPTLCTCPIGTPEGITGQAFWLTVFGMVIMFSFPAKTGWSFYSKLRGPLWSRRRKLWYRVEDPMTKRA